MYIERVRKSESTEEGEGRGQQMTLATDGKGEHNKEFQDPRRVSKHLSKLPLLKKTISLEKDNANLTLMILFYFDQRKKK